MSASEEGEVKASSNAAGGAGDDDMQQQQQQQNQQSSSSSFSAAVDANDHDISRKADRRDDKGNRGDKMIKVLLSSMQAGALIGQGGAAVNELQKRTGTRIRVSNKSMTFPGTQLRVISIEGTEEQLQDAVKDVLDVCFQENKVEIETADVLLALPSLAAPVIIGKQGVKVAEIIKQAGCDIRLGKQSDEIPGVRERVATLKGKKEKVLAGVYAIMDLMFKDASGKAGTYENRSTNYDGGGRRDDSGRRDYRDDDRRGGRGDDSRHSRSDYGAGGGRDYRDDYRSSRSDRGDYRSGGMDYRDSRYPDRGGGSAVYDPRAAMDMRDPYRDVRATRDLLPPRPGALPYLPSGVVDDDRRGGSVVPLVQKPVYSTQVSVPDEYVGAMLGRSGENLAEIQRITRTRIHVSQRGEYVPDTRDRIVTISGAVQDCEIAKTMLAEKITKQSQ
jgi:transcription antitermination factor NusA-like protein